MISIAVTERCSANVDIELVADLLKIDTFNSHAYNKYISVPTLVYLITNPSIPHA